MAHGGMRIYEKLDRVFYNDDWRNLYLEAHVKVLHKLDYVDHHLVLITPIYKELRQVGKYFKFECAWLIGDNFEEMQKTSWDNHHPLLHNLDSLKATIM